MMLYRYKRDEIERSIHRKARRTLRGDLMKPSTQFGPRHIPTYTADRATLRLVIALHAQRNMPIEHLYIKSGYRHERYSHNRPVYIQESPQFEAPSHMIVYAESYKITYTPCLPQHTFIVTVSNCFSASSIFNHQNVINALT